MLEFPLNRHAFQYAKDVFDGKELSFALTANVTLLTDEIVFSDLLMYANNSAQTNCYLADLGDE